MAGIDQQKETYVTADTLDRELALWLDEVAPCNFRDIPPIEPARAALLVVDMNKPFVDEGLPLSSPNARAIVPAVQKTAANPSSPEPELGGLEGRGESASFLLWGQTALAQRARPTLHSKTVRGPAWRRGPSEFAGARGRSGARAL